MDKTKDIVVGKDMIVSVKIPNDMISIRKMAFSDCTNLTSVTFEEDSQLTSIEDFAFNGCKSLESITIPTKVASIGEYAFTDCVGLENIIIPSAVKSIGKGAFFDCKSLISVTFEQGSQLTSVSDATFYDCYNLLNIIIPDGVASISVSAFLNCYRLTAVTIPTSVTNIGEFAFASCTNLTKVYYTGSQEQWNKIAIGKGNDALTNATIKYALDVEDSKEDINYSRGLEYTLFDDETHYIVTGIGTCTDTDIVIPLRYNDKPVMEIGNSAFNDCDGIKSVTIPSSIASIGYYAFRFCTSLTSINVDENNQYYKSIDGNLYSKTGKTLVLYAMGKTDTSFTVPPSVAYIGDYAFYGCDSLTSITLPDSVTSIGDYAFSDCSSLESIIIPYGITSIGDCAFYYCESLTNITIPDGVTSIGDSAFEGCYSLSNITIPDSVTSIGDSAFYECDSLIGVFYTGTVEQWWDYISIGSDNECLTNATIKYNFDGEEDDRNKVINPDSQTLYIYKGNIGCKRYNHNILSATATLHNIAYKDVVINVEYCTDCRKYLLSYDLFMRYRERYGVLIGDFKIVTNSFFEGETQLAEESPLHLPGYNVGQKDDYSSNQRHYILARIIHDGIMTKQAVLNYLSYFVRMNGARWGMELAVSKWKEDISFVQDYNMSTQPKTIISRITKY